MSYKRLPLALLFLLFSVQVSFSQLGFSHEIGAIIGPVQFRSDYGIRNNEETNFGNTGIGIGIIHYINFSYSAECNCYSTDTYFNDHFKLRSEISWNYTPLDHFGTYANAPRLKPHKGEAQNFDIGMQLEYFPLSIRSFQAFSYRFAPFVSLGIHYVNYHPDSWTTFGTGNVMDPANIYGGFDLDDDFGWWDASDPPDYYPLNLDSGSTWSLVTSVGVRYKLTKLSDLMLDMRWQYYGSDWIDGLNHKLSYNKYNDWLLWLNFGYIYYLD
ncbi:MULTISPECIES: glutamate dehydrogenase [Mangrovimonas]|uniref:THC0290_0291 family protein n=1 Tax=Mangrovimonas TaxID=1211036 RepID=UPI0006B526CD|nr:MULTISPECIES: glutamate dehydrogenase [Mangrovimonas]MCF1420704.1 glutamate dehydrogenase [Mangrovimonas futianensis]NIK91057.1 glutamate dehydrogenase [Mangrovimonas sp. CR14]